MNCCNTVGGNGRFSFPTNIVSFVPSWVLLSLLLCLPLNPILCIFCLPLCVCCSTYSHRDPHGHDRQHSGKTALSLLYKLYRCVPLFQLDSMIFRFDLIRTNQCVGLDLSNLLMICNRENMSGFCRIGSSIRGFCLSAISPGQAGHEHEPDK